MNSNQSSNMTLEGFQRVHLNSFKQNELMTTQGTLNKILILSILVFISGFFGWNLAINFVEFIMPLMITTLIIGVVIALTLAFKPMLAHILAPLYSIIQGFFLGVISMFFEFMYPGIVIQALLITSVIAFIMNFLYRAKIIKVTEKFRSVIIFATFGIFGVYLVSLLLNLFTGSSIPLIHESGLIGIGFSLFVVTIASLNLLIDFDLIERQIKAKMPKRMEWYGGFVIMVTLIWIYIEVLKLLAKLKNR